MEDNKHREYSKKYRNGLLLMRRSTGSNHSDYRNSHGWWHCKRFMATCAKHCSKSEWTGRGSSWAHVFWYTTIAPDFKNPDRKPVADFGRKLEALDATLHLLHARSGVELRKQYLDVRGHFTVAFKTGKSLAKTKRITFTTSVRRIHAPDVS